MYKAHEIIPTQSRITKKNQRQKVEEFKVDVKELLGQIRVIMAPLIK